MGDRRRLCRRLGVAFGLTVASVVQIASPVEAASFSDPAFVDETYVSGLPGVVEMAWLPDGRMLAAQQSGVVRVVDGGVLQPTAFIDISAQVNGIRDRGLLGLTVHPDFPSQPYVYLLFTYDPPETTGQTGLAAPNGRGARVSRLIRVTADAATGYSTAVAGSDVVLMGTNSTAAHVNIATAMDTLSEVSCDTGGVPVRDCMPADSESHTIGSVRFGTDGMLYVGNGDASSYTQRDPRALRSLDVDSMAGKIFRIDPITGQGLSDNPFWDGDADSNRSKVHILGLRNPFRFIVDPDTGAMIIGDVGWGSWEEINVGTAGDDFGWPCYEGGEGTNVQQGNYAGLAECAAYYGSNSAEPGTIAWNRQGQGGAAVAGVVYTGSAYPAEYTGRLFYGDYAQGWARSAVRSGDNLTSPTLFTSDIGAFVAMSQGPDDLIYYIDIIGGAIKRIRYDADQPPPQVRYEYYEGSWSVLPNFDALTPVATGLTPGFDIGVRQRNDQFGFRFDACLEVPDSGTYTFFTNSDDGSQLFIDGALVVDNDGLHAPREVSGSVSLAAGVHPITVTMFEQGGGEVLDVRWQGPSFGKQDVPRSVLVGCDTTLTASPSPIDFGSVAGSADQLVTLAHSGAAGEPDVQITDVSVSGSTDFSVGVVDLPLTLSPGESTAVTVTFTPSGTAASAGSLDVEHNGINSVTSVALSGSGENQPPTISILQPFDGQIVRINTEVDLAATASDADGPVTVQWEGTLNHGDDHVHPGEFFVDGATGSFLYTDHDDNAWIEACATATDSGGLTATQCVDVYPETVSLTFDTAPSGLDITYNGVTRTTPFTVDAVIDASRALDAPASQGGLSFQSWSNGGAASQTLTIPDTPTTFVATYAPDASPPDAVDDSLTVDQNGTGDVDVLANDTDPDGDLDPSSVTIVSGPQDGAASVTGPGVVSYTPDTDYFGADALTYQVCDDAGQCSTATVSITVLQVSDAVCTLGTDGLLRWSSFHGEDDSYRVLRNGRTVERVLVSEAFVYGPVDPAQSWAIRASERGVVVDEPCVPDDPGGPGPGPACSLTNGILSWSPFNGEDDSYRVRLNGKTQATVAFDAELVYGPVDPNAGNWTILSSEKGVLEEINCL